MTTIQTLTGRVATLLSAAAMMFPLSAQAVMYDFGPDCDAGGCGTATMDISISGNTLTLKLDNTSPTTLDSGSGTNTPGITGFGFNVADPEPSISSWSLTAYNTDGSGPVTIGDGDPTDDWVMNTFVGGVSLDFLPTAGDPAQIKGALYNPSATSGFGATPNYETQAILTINFDSAPVLAEENCRGGVGDCTTFVRMQNVGLNGGGSLKLPGTSTSSSTSTSTSNGVPPSEIPESNILALLGAGLLGGVLARRRLRK